MARNFDGLTDRIGWSAPVIWGTGQAFTISMWVYDVTRSGGGNGRYYWIAHQSGDAAIGVILYDINLSTSYTVYASGSTSMNRQATGASFFGTGSWYHLLATWDGTMTDATTAHIYTNGSEVSYAAANNGATQNTPSGSWSAGGRIFDDIRNVAMRHAELAVWNRVLSAAEIAILADGYSPLFINNSLVFYPQSGMVRETPNDYISGNAATLDGTTVIEHPPGIIYPSSPNRVISIPESTPSDLAVGGGGLYDLHGRYHPVG